MISPVPLPGWSSLLALAGRAPAPDAVAAPWRLSGDGAAWHSRSAWSLAALAGRLAAELGRPAVFWLPDYFCDGSLGPLRRAGARIAFYPIAEDFAARLSEPGDQPRPDAVVLVHFFGRPSDAEAARRFCDGLGAVLIEDAAHVLKPGPRVGRWGDWVLYSPHKLLAVPDGALLVARHPPAPVAPAGAFPSPLPWLVKRLVRKLVPPALLPKGPGGPARHRDDPAPGSLAATPSMSPLALRLLSAAPSLDAVAAERRRNAARLATALAALPGWSPAFSLADEDVIPYRLVMRCQSPELAERRYQSFRRAGIPVESWPDLAPEVKADPGRHRAALALRATVICFPVHQGIAMDELIRRCPRQED